jgi:hypothetical protein
VGARVAGSFGTAYYASARDLDSNMRAMGAVRPDGTVPHHITSRLAEAAKKTRAKLISLGVTDFDVWFNGVYLPAVRGCRAKGMYHPTLHTGRCYDAVERMMDRASSADEARMLLRTIVPTLARGEVPEKTLTPLRDGPGSGLPFERP